MSVWGKDSVCVCVAGGGRGRGDRAVEEGRVPTFSD